jgi:hypothetical protein
VKTAVYDSQKTYEFDYQNLKKEKSGLSFFEPYVSNNIDDFNEDRRFST